jgi:hypothetical protein
MSEQHPTMVFGIPLGSWIQWVLPITVGLAVTYGTQMVAPIDARLKNVERHVELADKTLAEYQLVRQQCEKRMDTLEKVFEVQRQHMMSTYQTKEQSSRDYEHLMRLIENARR